MNKFVISTLDTQIEFLLSKDRKITIDPKIPVLVTEEELLVLKSRLGSNIKEVQTESNVPVEETPVEETPVEEEVITKKNKKA